MNPVTTKLRGQLLLREPLLNKGTAFSLEERAQLGLNGLLPPQVKTLDQQRDRAYSQYGRQPDDLAKNVYLTALHDRNEVLFYRLLTDHLPEMLPIVYTPTVALAIERYSHQYRRPRGLFLSIDHPELLEESFRNSGLGPKDVDSMGNASWVSATGALAGSTSPSASSTCTPRPAGSTRRG